MRQHWVRRHGVERTTARRPAASRALTWAAATLALLSAVWAAATTPATAEPARAEPYPSRTIRMVVPFPAGGGADVLVRMLTHHMAEDLGAQFVVVNQPGAGGALALEQVARAAPDGYTLTWISTGFPVMAATIPALSFDPARDFTHVGQAAENPFVLVVNKDLPVGSVAELVALAKQKPNTLNFAHNGSGTLTKLALGLFQQEAGVQLGEVGYRGDNFSIADVAAGHVHGMFSNSPVALPQVESGRLKALAVTATRRSAAAPSLPTMAEAGVPNIGFVVWHGMSGPAGMPPDIVARLNGALRRALGKPDVIAHSRSFGVEIAGTSPEEFDALVRRELATWSDVAKRANVAVR